jgi:hypothetical protein
MKTNELAQAVQASAYGHPNVYPNSEHIKPPQEKERIRIVEQATRAEVKLNQQREIEDRIEEINTLRQQAAIRYTPDGKNTISPGETQGQFVDIEA